MPPFGQNYAAGNPNNYLGAGGQQNPALIPPGASGQQQFTEDFYTYAVTLAAITAGQTLNQTIQIQADSDFQWIMASTSANVASADEPWTDALIIPITVLMTDAGSGRLLMSIPVPVTGIAGTGKQPFILPIPRTFKSKSSITLSFTNYGGSTYDNFYFNMIGRKIFDVSQ